MRFLLFILLPCCVLFGCAQQAGQPDQPGVTASAETAAIPSFEGFAIDVAVWVNPTSPRQSLVLATDSGYGIVVYDLAGTEVQRLPLPGASYIDVRNAPWQEWDQSLVVAAQTESARVTLYTLDHTSGAVRQTASLDTEITSPTALCLFQNAQHNPYLTVSGADGRFIQYGVSSDFELRPLRRWQSEPTPEHCFVDDRGGRIYYGQQNVGIWWVHADPSFEIQPQTVDLVENGVLIPPIRGMALHQTSEQTHLIVANEGDDSLALYDTRDHSHQFSVRIASGDRIDGITRPVSVAATANPLPGYAQGLVLVHDAFNANPVEQQNFKFVSWQSVLAAVSARLAE